MPTRFLSKNYPVPDSTGNANGFAFDTNDNLKANRVKASTGAADPGYVPINAAELKTANYTVPKADHGKTLIANSGTTINFTLPSTQVGLEFTFVVGAVTASGGHSVTPAAADKIMGNGLTKADAAALVCSAASDRQGDLVTLVGDGVDGWYIKSVVGTWV